MPLESGHQGAVVVESSGVLSTALDVVLSVPALWSTAPKSKSMIAHLVHQRVSERVDACHRLCMCRHPVASSPAVSAGSSPAPYRPFPQLGNRCKAQGSAESFPVSEEPFATFWLSSELEPRRIEIHNLWPASTEGGFLAWMLWSQGSPRIPPRKSASR
jgi:hypothetical protein